MKQIIFCIAFILACMPLMADWQPESQEPCLPDCENDTFVPAYPNPPFSLTITLDCGEIAEVYYRTRKACNIYHDIYIEYVEFHPLGQGYINAYNCGQTMTTAEILANAAEQVMIENPMQWPPANNGECNYIWRVMKGSCWYANFPTQSPSGGLINPESNENNIKQNSIQDPQLPSKGNLYACNETECCLEAFNVCMENDERTATYLPEESLYPECIDQSCEPVCGSVYSR